MSEQARIEESLAQTRSRMNNRLDDLQARLTPDRIIDDVVDYVKGSDGGEFARNLMAGAKRNPIPTAIAGIGLAWLMAANSRDRRYSEPTARNASQRWTDIEEFDDHVGRIDSSVVRTDAEDDTTYTDRLHDARGKALGVARGVQDTTATYAAKIGDAMQTTRDSLSRRTDYALKGASALSQNVSDRASDLQRNAADSANYAGERLAQGGRALRDTGGDMLNSLLENPIMLGAIGLGAGALLGALLPQPTAEEDALSGVAEKARSTLRDLGQDVVDRGGAAAQQVMNAATESAHDHGLGGEKDLGTLANEAGSGNLTGHVSAVAKDVLKAADDSIRTGSAATEN